MVTLTKKTLDFNRKIKLSNDGGSLSSDTGECLFREFDEKIGFSKTVENHLKLDDPRAYYFHSNENLLRQKIYQIIAGYYEDDAADQLTNDPVFTQVIDTPALASQPSLSRFYTRFNQKSIDHLNHANQELCDKIHAFRKSQALFIDSAMPTSVNSAVIAQEYNNHPNFAAQIVLFSTMISAITVSIVIYFSRILF